MQASIARTLAMVCHANAKLRGLTTPAITLEHSALKFAESVTFVVRNEDDTWVCVARDVGELLGIESPHDYLKTLRATCARFEHSYEGKKHPWSDVGAIGGGGLWTMVWFADDGRAYRWGGRERIGDRNAKDRRIWIVEHALIQVQTRAPGPKESVPAAERALRAAIEAAHSFAVKEHPDFSDHFVRGLRALDGERLGYHHDLAPPGAISEAALRLFEAVQASWVFGGMGSWNDIGSPPPEYVAISDALFAAQMGALTAAANDSAI